MWLVIPSVNILLFTPLAVSASKRACAWCVPVANSWLAPVPRIRVPWLSTAWNVTLTFVFITFTRLFFRAGSNLDPAEANEVAWNTAKNMVHQMGTAWRVDMIFPIAWEHINIILVFIAGMLIHWIPKRVKSRYRIIFASLPIPLMVLATAFIIFIIYQFMSADSCPFIYFQF